jgi:acyl-coenzyme A synthetase/AMP-(fatty) acid ligase
VNFSSSVVEAKPPQQQALIELARDGSRHTWSFGDVASMSARLAGTIARHGVGRGDVVATLIGNRPEWILTMIACFRIGAVVMPCNEQLRANDLRVRLAIAQPAILLIDGRNRDEVEQADPRCPVVDVTAAEAFDCEPSPAVELDAEDPALLTFTSGSTGTPKGVVHAQRYLSGQCLQAEHWLGARPGDVVWCTATSGWSKSARNVFIAPWLCDAVALLHDRRFDPEERVRVIREERVNVLCMAPTEYRVLAKRCRLRGFAHLRELVAAGEALDADVVGTWHAATGLWIRDGFGQTETGQLTGHPPGSEPELGSIGPPLPGVNLWVEDGELLVDPTSVPTFFLGYLDPDRSAHQLSAATGPWKTGDRVTRSVSGALVYEGREDDVIISSGYRIGPGEVESVLLTHPAVEDAAAVPAPDEVRGSIVRAVVVLREDYEPSSELAKELQEHVKRETAPYKYPRLVEFTDALPRTSSGKLQRAFVRATPPSGGSQV